MDRLLGSDIFRGQKAAVGRQVPPSPTSGVGWRRSAWPAERSRASRSANGPPSHQDGFLDGVRRILNVDGYEVLRVDRAADRVVPDLPLLLHQFGIG